MSLYANNCLNNSYFKNYKNCVQELNQIFDENTHTGRIFKKKGPQGLLKYYTQEHCFNLAITPCTWGLFKETSTFYGNIGHHLFLRLPGKRVCEWTRHDPTPHDTSKTSQIEIRKATGKKIEAMWRTYQEMHSQYYSFWGFACYMPFINDCHTFVNTILTKNSLTPAKLSRLPHVEKIQRSPKTIVSVLLAITLVALVAIGIAPILPIGFNWMIGMSLIGISTAAVTVPVFLTVLLRNRDTI